MKRLEIKGWAPYWSVSSTRYSHTLGFDLSEIAEDTPCFFAAINGHQRDLVPLLLPPHPLSSLSDLAWNTGTDTFSCSSQYLPGYWGSFPFLCCEGSKKRRRFNKVVFDGKAPLTGAEFSNMSVSNSVHFPRYPYICSNLLHFLLCLFV